MNLSTVSRRLLMTSVVAVGLASPSAVRAQIQLGADQYSENFDRIDKVKTADVFPWVDNVTVPGWYATSSLKGPVTFRVTKGATASLTPSLWVVRTAPPEAALGMIRGTKNGQPTFSMFGACFVNKTEKVITALTINYRGEQWAENTGGPDRLDFQYSLDATSLSNGQWTDHDALDFNAPHTGAKQMAALDGNQEGNSTALKSTITGLSIKPGATFWVRWTDFAAEGENAALAVDDFTLKAETAP